MAVPAYTEDLTDIDLAESASTGWTAFNISGGGGGAPAFGADLGMQGAGCWDKPASNAERGLAVNKTPGTGTVAAGIHIFVWGFNATPGLSDTLANRGAYVIIGTSTANFMQFHVEGSNTYGAAGRVARCYVVDYVTTSNTGSIPYRTVNGTPGATPTYFGFGLKTLATVKGSNIGCDAIRYGTGAYITAGDATTPATFAGFNAQNDSINNRWGILTAVGSAYELQGRFVIGQNNSQVATLAYFEDSDVSISLVDTVHSATDFTQFIIDHASTEVYWTNINITALGTNNPGRIVVNNASSVFDIIGGVFTDIGITTLRAACTADGTTWRGCDAITLNSATLDNCLIDSSSVATSSAAVVTDDLADLQDNTFIGNSNHAVELTSLGTGTMTWNNYLDTASYASSDGTAGTEAIYVNVGSGTLTINVGSGYSTPYIRTAGATVTVVSGQATMTVTVRNQEDNSVIQGAAVTVTPSDNTGPFPWDETVTITRSGSTATVSHTAHGLSTGHKVKITGADQNEYNRIKTITVTGANAYTFTVSGTPTTPATGTIKATAIIIDGVTNASGVISDTRAYGSNQPVSGSVKKGSEEPVFVPGSITGTVDSGNGLSTTVLLIPD